MSNSVRVVQYGIDVLVRNDIENATDIEKVLRETLEQKGFYVLGMDCNGWDGEYPGLDSILVDENLSSEKYSGSVPTSYERNPEVGHMDDRELKVVRYLKGQGHPHPEEDGTLDEFMNGGDRQAMYDEAVENNYHLGDVDRWFHLLDVMGIDLNFETAMKIDRALYEADLETMELALPEERKSFEDKPARAGERSVESSPDLFSQAFEHYSAIDRSMAGYKEYLECHKDKLIYCFQNNLSLDLIDVDFWVQYEWLLDERLSYDEYLAVDGSFDGDPHEIDGSDEKMIGTFREALEKQRGNNVNVSGVDTVENLIDSSRKRCGDVNARAGVVDNKEEKDIELD